MLMRQEIWMGNFRKSLLTVEKIPTIVSPSARFGGWRTYLISTNPLPCDKGFYPKGTNRNRKWNFLHPLPITLFLIPYTFCLFSIRFPSPRFTIMLVRVSTSLDLSLEHLLRLKTQHHWNATTSVFPLWRCYVYSITLLSVVFRSVHWHSKWGTDISQTTDTGINRDDGKTQSRLC